MQHLGLRSLPVLTKIGYDLRDQLAYTSHETAEEAFGPLIAALYDAEAVLSLATNKYQWSSDDTLFRYARVDT